MPFRLNVKIAHYELEWFVMIGLFHTLIAHFNTTTHDIVVSSKHHLLTHLQTSLTYENSPTTSKPASSTSPHPTPVLTSTTHTYTDNPAPGTSYASQTNPLHDAHETHAYTSCKTPSALPHGPHPSSSQRRPPSPGPGCPATSCRYRNAACGARTADTPGPSCGLANSRCS